MLPLSRIVNQRSPWQMYTLATRPTRLFGVGHVSCCTRIKLIAGLTRFTGDAKFVSNYSTVTHPLNELLRDNVDWKRSDRERKAFDTLKEKLSDAPVLTHFSEKLPLKLDTDASNYGIGAVISHIYPSGEERPIAYASRTLNKSERNYPQIEKEALSIVFGVRKFHQYLYGRKFILVTDHKPLVSLLGPKTGIPTLAAARMQRWALLLSGYQYDIEYR